MLLTRISDRWDNLRQEGKTAGIWMPALPI
jgi:hypothetical protein